MKGSGIEPLTTAHANTVGVNEFNLKRVYRWLYSVKTHIVRLVDASKLFAPIMKHPKWNIMLLAIILLSDPTPFKSSN